MGSQQHLAGFFKGWIYLGVTALFLFLLAYRFEIREPKAKSDQVAQQTPDSKGSVVPPEPSTPKEVVPSGTTPESETFEAPEPTEGAYPSTEREPTKAPPSPSPISPRWTQWPTDDREGEGAMSMRRLPPEGPADMPTQAVTQASPPEQGHPAEVSLPQTVAAVGQTTTPIVPSTQAPVTVQQATPQIAVQAIPLASTSPQAQGPQEAKQGLATCELLAIPEPAESYRVNRGLQLELHLTQPKQLLAGAACSVAKIHAQPTGGFVLYLLTLDGQWCLVYTGLESLSEGLSEGVQLPCGAVLGSATKLAFFEKWRVTAPSPWWKGIRETPSPWCDR